MQDILAAPIDRKTIFRHRTLNDNFFGKLTIYPSGEVYANVNCSVLGNIQDSSLKELLYKEITEGNAWLRIRGNEKPCNQCVNRDLCPSISNYELVIGKTIYVIYQLNKWTYSHIIVSLMPWIVVLLAYV